MGKRRDTTSVLSSDHEEAEGRPLKRSYSKPKSRPLATRTNPREPKKTRFSGSGSNLDPIKFPCQDFDDFFYGSKVSAARLQSGSGSKKTQELWVHKYKPCSLEELAVHKKKVEEVRSWFEERLTTSKDGSGNYVLIITGQAGVGKSTTVQLIASHYGARVCEWNTPTPTIWQEHLHNANTGIQYTSKLDEFVNFIEKVRKYGLIPSSFLWESKTPIILLLDDLPVTNGRYAFERLKNSLLLLVRSTCVPTAVLITDYGKADSTDLSARFLEELQSSLVGAGACKVAFNPITNNSIKKMLTRICRLERCDVSADQIELLAKTSGGDIRHAITSFQLFCLKQDPVLNSPASTLTTSYADGKCDDIDSLVSGFSLLFGRDESLSLFHALGKFLHNKRETKISITSDQDGFLPREKFSRLPLKMDTPEKVLCQAHGQARPIADFLHENVLEFMSDEAMDDAYDVASYLSDTDLLLSSFRGVLARYNEADNVLQSAAASVAVRGVLFGNSHPSPPRWHAIRKPKLWQVEQSIVRNQNEMARKRFIAEGESYSFDTSNFATEYTLVFKWLGGRSSVVEAAPVFAQGNEIDGDNYEKMSLDNEGTNISDDDIEDW